MKECLQNITQEEIQTVINNRFSSMIEGGFYISSVNTTEENIDSVDKTMTNICYTITFGKIQEKKPKEILDKKEKEWLENFLRPFRDKVDFIEKVHNDICGQFIRIQVINYLNRCELINLPYFEEDTMYKGMEVGKEYTLKELRLFE